MGTWHNDDGLFIRFGNDETAVEKGGEHMTPYSAERTWTLDFDFNDLDGTNTVIFDEIIIPNDVIIESATLNVRTAFDSAGDAATLTIGLIDQNRSTAIDADGIDATIAESAIDAENDTITCDGILIGTQLSNTGYLTMAAGTEAFTAGAARLTILGRSAS